MSAPEIVIASAKRTAVGSFNGAFGNTPAHELGAARRPLLKDVFYTIVGPAPLAVRLEVRGPAAATQ